MSESQRKRNLEGEASTTAASPKRLRSNPLLTLVSLISKEYTGSFLEHLRNLKMNKRLLQKKLLDEKNTVLVDDKAMHEEDFLGGHINFDQTLIKPLDLEDDENNIFLVLRRNGFDGVRDNAYEGQAKEFILGFQGIYADFAGFGQTKMEPEQLNKIAFPMIEPFLMRNYNNDLTIQKFGQPLDIVNLAAHCKCTLLAMHGVASSREEQKIAAVAQHLSQQMEGCSHDHNTYGLIINREQLTFYSVISRDKRFFMVKVATCRLPLDSKDFKRLKGVYVALKKVQVMIEQTVEHILNNCAVDRLCCST
ncbi:hypothetical protein MAM1_0323c09671 [Mucor ambiguus]|uniref:Uncharacterized protein n=1 Tax=Mucor ambiguus TaxID=91626 RepID=A0A0C9MRQ5_9FUNG|nr:hypothetical protein MAM1_0323c09671 [Mucor ambiguus]